MEKLTTNYDVAIQWHAYELRPAEAGPLPDAYRAKVEAGRPRLYAIAKEQYDLDLNPGPWGINSRPAHIGAQYAARQGCGKAYSDAVLRAYWHEAQDISNPEVLAGIAEAVGLARAPFLAALADDGYRSAMMADVEQAHLYGLQGVPALIFANKYLVSGAQPYPVLEQVVQKIQAEGWDDSAE